MEHAVEKKNVKLQSCNSCDLTIGIWTSTANYKMKYRFVDYDDQKPCPTKAAPRRFI